jgi:hypothetical protein
VDALKGGPTAEAVEHWIELERRFQAHRTRPLSFLEHPLRPIPQVFAYATFGTRPAERGWAQANVKARVVDIADPLAPDGVFAAPIGAVVTVTLLRPLWRLAKTWLPTLWQDCQRRVTIRHENLAHLFAWGVAPALEESAFEELFGTGNAPESPNPTLFLVRDHVEGTALGGSGKPAADLGAFRREASDICRALHTLHDSDLFGRGLSPQSVVRTPEGGLVLLDSPWAELPRDATEGVAPDARAQRNADLVGLGRVLLRIYTGQEAGLSGSDAVQAAVAVATRTDVPQIIGRLLSASEAERPTVDEVLQLLERLPA